MSRVTLRGIGKAFGSRRVLDGCDLEVADGEIMAVLGPSGGGKTTMLRIIAGFLDPDHGTVHFDERAVAGPHRGVPPQRRRVGYVPQEGALFPHLDVRGNILFGLPRAERTEERLLEMLDLADLGHDLAGSFPHQLSGGQQQRVALARALAPRPRVVLLDEPFSSLDASLRLAAGRSVTRVLRAAGTTAILVTHDQGEALSLADRVAVFRDGRVAQVSAPVDLYRRPADVAVAMFVGGGAALPATLNGTTADCLLGVVEVEEGAHPGGTVTVLVRPEQIHLVDAGGAQARARVDAVDFFGAYATVRLSLLDADGAAVVGLVARVGATDLPRVGDVTGVHVHGPVGVSG